MKNTSSHISDQTAVSKKKNIKNTGKALLLAGALAAGTNHAQAHSVEFGMDYNSGERKLMPVATATIDGTNTAVKMALSGTSTDNIRAYGLAGGQINDTTYVIGGASVATTRMAGERVNATGVMVEATKTFPTNPHVAYVRGGVSHNHTSSGASLPTTSLTTPPVITTTSRLENGVVNVTDTTTSWDTITTGGQLRGERKTSAFAEVAPRISNNVNAIVGVQGSRSNFDGNKTTLYGGAEYQGNGWNARATVDTERNIHAYVEKRATDNLSVIAGATYDHNRRDTMAMVGLRYEFDRPKSTDTVSSPTTHMRQRMDQIGFHDPRMARPSVRDERYTHVQNHSTTTQTRWPSVEFDPQPNTNTNFSNEPLIISVPQGWEVLNVTADVRNGYVRGMRVYPGNGNITVATTWGLLKDGQVRIKYGLRGTNGNIEFTREQTYQVIHLWPSVIYGLQP